MGPFGLVLAALKKQDAQINESIRAPELRVVLDDGSTLGVIPTSEAVTKARELGLDLIEVSPNAKPPVAKITDYGKFQYEQKKKDKEARLKAHIIETKTLQVKIATGTGDLELKAKNATKWLTEGHRVKADLFLRGRAKYKEQSFHKERLQRILDLITVPYKIVDDFKKSPKGLTVIIERDKSKKADEPEKKVVPTKNEVKENTKP